jgi:Kelch motif/Galactose oxidase, central domain
MRRLALALPALALAACTVTGTQQCPSQARPSARSDVAAVYVPTTNQIYALGGQGPLLPLDDLWRYSFGPCGGWLPLTLMPTPGPRAGYAAAFDSMRDRIVYIGGAATNDVWALDTDALSFGKLGTVGTSPTPAAAQLAAYDAEHDRVVYAGIETFALDFGMSDQGDWTFLDPTSLRAPASGALDPTRSLLVALDADGLHGFSLLTNTWHDITQSGDLPTTGAGLAWNGGTATLVAVADGVWIGTLDANGTSIAWQALSVTNPPPARSSFAVAVSGSELWLSGGITAANCTLDDLWTLDLGSAAWTNVWPATTCS